GRAARAAGPARRPHPPHGRRRRDGPVDRRLHAAHFHRAVSQAARGCQRGGRRLLHGERTGADGRRHAGHVRADAAGDCARHGARRLRRR
ncbi:hypothetical protein BN1708_020186, partial [Verticillium longisporum]